MMLGAWVPGFGLFLWTQSGHPSDLGRKLGGGVINAESEASFHPPPLHLAVLLFLVMGQSFPRTCRGGGVSEKTLTAMFASLAQLLLSRDWFSQGLCPHILPTLPFSLLSGAVL